MSEAIHPGKLLLATLDALGMAQVEVARRAGMSTKHVNQVCQGKAGVGADLAVQLEEITGVDAADWMRAQALYDIADARVRHLGRVEAQRAKQAEAVEAVRGLLGEQSRTDVGEVTE